MKRFGSARSFAVLRPLLARTVSASQFGRVEKNKSRQRAARLPSTTYDVSSGSPNTARGGFSPKAAEELVSLPPLRCPGGPRLRAEGIKQLFKVPHAGILAQYDQRFVLNLKLTHQLVSYLSRTTLKTPDKVLVELGPGAGTLTRSLLTRPCVGVLGVEVDERFNAHLEQIRAYTNGKFQWVNADVLKVDELTLLREAFPRFVDVNLRHPPTEAGGEPSGSGYEGAPLRSSQREHILRQRAQRSGSGGAAAGARRSRGSSRTARRVAETIAAMDGAVSGDGGAHAEEGSSYSYSTHRTSPNPAFDITDHWWADGDAKVEVVANLPFDIITELLMRYAVDCSRHRGLFAFGRVPLHVFTQKEIADRVLAPAGSLAFSRLSVLIQCYFHVRLKQTFTEWTYFPRTEVLGALLLLEPRAVPLASGLDGAALIHFTDLLMKPGQRGTTVHKALLTFAPPEVAQYILQECRMDGAVTVLDLTVEEVVQMAVLWRQFITTSQQQQ